RTHPRVDAPSRSTHFPYTTLFRSQFFEKIEAESKGGNPAEFFSNHPSPEHRMERVNDEVEKLGGPPSGYKTDSAEFRENRSYSRDRKSTRLNSSHGSISYAVFCLK